MRLLLIGLFVLFSLTMKSQNNVTISGYINDGTTGEPIIGATVFDLSSLQGTISNTYGFYSLTIKSCDSATLEISHLGYKKKKLKIACNESELNIHLIPGVTLQKVTVSARKGKSVVQSAETGIIRLPIRDIKILPNLFGEVDIIKAYQLTPGVQSGGGGKSELYVRGGSPDQNLIMLDGVPLYYIAHFGGFFSIFNSDAISKVKLIKGGFPARYGSRLSSILDVRMREGNVKDYTTSGTVGLLSSKLSFEGPIKKDTSSFLLSARKNILPVFKLFDSGLGYNFYDLNAKFNYKFSSRNKILFSFYKGDDILKQKSNNLISERKNTIQWGNTLTAIRWNHVFNKKLFSNTTLSNTHYRYKQTVENKYGLLVLQHEMQNHLTSSINDFGMNSDFTYYYNPDYTLHFGISSIWHSFVPNNEKYEQSGDDVINFKRIYQNKFQAIENALYVENSLSLKRLKANIGLRLSSYHIKTKSYYFAEPRLVINYVIIDNLAVKYSYSLMNQFIHLLSYSGVGVPSDYWMPSTEKVRPETSSQHTFSIVTDFNNSGFELSLEGYYKTMSNLITFRPGENLLGNFKNWEQVAELDGTGNNYGLELFLQKAAGKTTGWIGATIAKATRKFENINNGKEYPFKYDRRYDVSIVVNHRIKDNITLSATWIYGSGYPITLAEQHYNIEEFDVFIYGEKNSFRMKDYHRLDIAANFSKQTKWGERTWTISVFNLYNRMNPYYYYYEKQLLGSTVKNGVFHPVYSALKLYQKTLLGIVPSISYSFKF